jgi:hypothetical protein
MILTMTIDPRRIEVIDDQTAEIYRRMSPAERVQRGLEMGSFARAVIECRVRELRPDWTDDQVRSEVARRFAGDC